LIPTALKNGVNGATSSDNVNCGHGATLNNLTVYTLMAWCMPTVAPSASRLMTKSAGVGTGGSGRNFTIHNISTRAAFQIGRATASMTCTADLVNFAAYALNIPLFFAATVDLSAGLPKMYMGSLTMPCAEPSAYAAQTLGSGAAGDDSATDWYLGNYSGLNVAFVGPIWVAGVWATVFDLGRLRELQRHPSPATSRGFWLPGQNGTGRVWDLSGNNNHGTITGALPTSDVLPRVGRRAA